ncbi:MAG: hypothetical protein ACLSDQ_02420 [Adlercreutzia equolifaciens]
MCGPNVTTTGFQSWNTCICNGEVDGEELVPDYLWDARSLQGGVDHGPDGISH